MGGEREIQERDGSEKSRQVKLTGYSILKGEETDDCMNIPQINRALFLWLGVASGEDGYVVLYFLYH